jgi:hypothetical protein
MDHGPASAGVSSKGACEDANLFSLDKRATVLLLSPCSSGAIVLLYILPMLTIRMSVSRPSGDTPTHWESLPPPPPPSPMLLKWTFLVLFVGSREPIYSHRCTTDLLLLRSASTRSQRWSASKPSKPMSSWDLAWRLNHSSLRADPQQGSIVAAPWKQMGGRPRLILIVFHSSPSSPPFRPAGAKGGQSCYH